MGDLSLGLVTLHLQHDLHVQKCHCARNCFIPVPFHEVELGATVGYRIPSTGDVLRTSPVFHVKREFKMKILTMIALLCSVILSGCVMDGPRPTGGIPPMKAESDEVPTAIENEIAETLEEQGRCAGLGVNSPSFPETDCTAWSFLYSLTSITNDMAGISLDLTEDELKILELEVYPSFVQAQQNCGEWYGSSKDYEPIADLFSMLSFLGKEGYAYDPPTLFRFLVVRCG